MIAPRHRFLARATSCGAGLLLATVAPSVATAQLLPSQPAERCTAAPGGSTAQQWLAKAAVAILPPSLDGRVLRYRVADDVPFWEQSDRMYPPFVPDITTAMRWFDPATDVAGQQPVERPLVPGRPPSLLFTSRAAYSARDTTVQPADFFFPQTAPTRRLNPWSILAEWRANAGDARLVQRCRYRDAWRIVLARANERLYLTESDGTPVKLERVEPHYLWGQTKTEYLWTTWWGVQGGGRYPLASFRVLDGEVYKRVAVTPGSAALVPADSAPPLIVPDVAAMSEALEIPSPTSDTVRVTDRLFELVTPAYTEAVTLQRDTVFIFDATSSETRARADSLWISKLFPGRHPVVLVVTDIAWPHISGVRFWVARGATVVSHAASEDFLRRVVARRWTLQPDALERARGTTHFVFHALEDSLRLGGGAVVLHALSGYAGEGAIGAWVPGERFFWAGDYIQPGSTSPYVRDVVQTVRALGIHPLKVGAQHIPLADWSAVDKRIPPTVQP